MVRLETRPTNIEGAGAITQRDLVINTLRMRPDRIIVGESRGAEALDMLQAMNTGHDGSMTTVHANSPRDAFSRLETMVMMASQHVPDKVIRQQLASAINIVVHCARLSDGTRKVTGIAEVVGVENDQVEMQDIFEFERTGISPRGKVLGSFRASGNTPICLERLKAYGIHLPASIFHEDARGEGEVDGRTGLLPDYRRALLASRCTRRDITSGACRSRRPRSGWAAACANCARTCAAAPEGRRNCCAREHRGQFAFLGDLVTWVGVLRRLQDHHRAGQPEVPRGRRLRAQRGARGVLLSAVRRCSA